MILKNKWFYFGKIPAKWDEEETLPGWEPGWYFRIFLNEDIEEFHIEDTCGRMVPLSFDNLFKLQQVLVKVQNELLTTLIGAPNPHA